MVSSTYNGPFSIKRPSIDDDPGPPCSHRSNGAFIDPCYIEMVTITVITYNITRAGKNQKNILLLYCSSTVKYPA